MRTILSIALLTCFASASLGQELVTNHPETLNSPEDVFHVKFSSLPRKQSFPIGKSDTVDMGTDGGPGKYAMIYYGSDSLRIDNTNFPYKQVNYIPIKSAAGLVKCRMRFNEVRGYYSEEYIAKNEGKVQTEIPEVFELANILLLLSPSGRRATNMNKDTDYAKEVLSYFKSEASHSVFKSLDFPDSLFMKNYYDFRENSLCFNFKQNKITSSDNYFYVMGRDDSTHSSLFKQLIPEIEDFAIKSNFREFYKAHQALYTQLVTRENQLVQAKNMWNWMEKEFPEKRFQSYKIVFSPLIRSSHSTQQFGCYQNGKLFREIVMFVSGPDDLDKNEKLAEKQKEGLLSGIVFTEIDHNYVNRISDNFSETIDSLFADRAKWTLVKGDTHWYGSPMSVFNEYMTHALFSLYVLDHYDKPTADFLIINREDLMTGKRGFTRFKDFNQKLIAERNQNKELPAMKLYPAILQWCKTQVL